MLLPYTETGNNAARVLVGNIEIQAARRRLASGRVQSHENQTVAARGKILYVHEHTDRHHWAAFLEKIIGSKSAGEKHFFIRSAFMNFVADSDTRGLVAAQQRVINLGVHDDFVRALEVVYSARNDLHSFYDKRSSVFQQNRIKVGTGRELFHGLRVVGKGNSADRELLSIVSINVQGPTGFSV